MSRIKFYLKTLGDTDPVLPEVKREGSAILKLRIELLHAPSRKKKHKLDKFCPLQTINTKIACKITSMSSSEIDFS